MLKPYSKKLDISYTVGVSPTIELLEQRPKDVIRIILSPKGTQNKGITKILDICYKLHIPFESDQRSIERISGNENTYAVGVFRKYASQLDQENNHVILVNPSDMGNLGTICRTMLAFDITNLALIRPAVDIFDPKSIRSSMGSIFSINFEYFDSFEDYQTKFKHNVYSFMSDGDTLLDKAIFKSPYSLVFGNEGEGLDKKYKDLGESIKIPQSNKVDSFNLSIAVGIAIFKAWEKSS
jgi:RNA methyltransferase, TrmH family